ncbi:protein of unknown function [Candidatus Nitrosotalea okcheonensis]|uniref:Uncharacterized protein n=1 Tax=Candidatus Nitrosotalea okcheonensis TaxID=1903276 RepID=A0A2H1FHV1_9ARCH|nr:protein of unknown function [Candidatus Nitrosotalea okcheonensis]
MQERPVTRNRHVKKVVIWLDHTYLPADQLVQTRFSKEPDTS